MMKRIVSIVLRWLFPERCVLCRRFIHKGYICSSCSEGETASERKINIPMGRRSRLIRVFSPHPYTGAYRTNIHRFKFGGVTHNAEAIGKLMVSRIPDEVFRNADIITFVPLAEDVRKGRGYNQAELLADSVSSVTGIPVIGVIRKTRQNKPQRTLSAKARQENVKGVFEVTTDIKGQNIILVDDIITTGATVTECAKMLFSAGALSVTGVCAADANQEMKNYN